jgi:hypothetical protein
LPGASKTLACAKTAQKYANPEQPEQTHCQGARHDRVMAKIIRIQFRRSRLPRRLLTDGWWLVAPSPRRSVIDFPKRPARKSNATLKSRHLTLITSKGKNHDDRDRD